MIESKWDVDKMEIRIRWDRNGDRNLINVRVKSIQSTEMESE